MYKTILLLIIASLLLGFNTYSKGFIGGSIAGEIIVPVCYTHKVEELNCDMGYLEREIDLCKSIIDREMSDHCVMVVEGKIKYCNGELVIWKNRLYGKSFCGQQKKK